MNIENLGVQELNSNELLNIEGGNWFAETLGEAVGLLVGSAVVAAHMAVSTILD